MLETLFSIYSDLLITWTICRKMEWKNHVGSCLNMTQMGIASHWLNMLQLPCCDAEQISCHKFCSSREVLMWNQFSPPWNHGLYISPESATISRGPADSPVEEFKAQCSDPLMERTSDWAYT